MINIKYIEYYNFVDYNCLNTLNKHKYVHNYILKILSTLKEYLIHSLSNNIGPNFITKSDLRYLL